MSDTLFDTADFKPRSDQYGRISYHDQKPLTAPYSAPGASPEAAASLGPSDLNEGQERVLEALRAMGGGTDEEVATRTGMNPSTVRPRRGELQERRLIEDSGRQRKTRSGRNATVWQITPKEGN
jgi:hypothetical protein